MGKSSTDDLQGRLEVAHEAIRKLEQRSLAGQFALELMHEIRNPLEALTNLLYVVSAESMSEPVRQYLKFAQEQVETLGDIAARTLDLTRIASLAQPRDMVTLADAALRIHRHKVERKKIRVVRDLPKARIMAEVYTTEMLQVLSNLLANAIDALPLNGTVCLRLRKRSDKVHFIVADNGHGIPPQHSRNIFEPYFTTKKADGTGLGLAISKRIVERHRGTLSMRSSVRPGKSGTLFKVSLPCV